MTKGLKQEYTLKISRANKTELVVILYEMLMIYVEEARTAYRENDKKGFRLGIQRARGCVSELIASLHLEYELAASLLQLYIYVNRELVRSDAKFTEEGLDNTRMVITGLHEVYSQVGVMDVSAPIMENVQSIFAGLTYGKDNLVENMADQGSNRGYYI